MLKVRVRSGGGSAVSQYNASENAHLEGRANIPTDFLRTFVAICELGSFTKAGRLFGLTQPAVSAQVRKLEVMVGGDLIERRSPGIAVTQRGGEVLQYARRMLAINDEILGVFARETRAPILRAGISHALAVEAVRTLMRDRRAQAANAKLQLCCDNSRNLLQKIRSGYLDIACVVGDEPEIVDAPASWSEEVVWTHAPDILPDYSIAVPLIGSPTPGLGDRIASEALMQANRQREVVFTAFDRNARHAAAAAGLGYLPMLKRHVPPTLRIEQSGHLPPLRAATVGIGIHPA